METGRGPDGKFIKGYKGGPGRPKVEEAVRELCRALSVEAVETLAKIMRSDTAKERERIMASNSILDRAYGKPAQQKNDNEDDPMDAPQIVVSVSKDEYEEMLHNNKIENDNEEDYE